MCDKYHVLSRALKNRSLKFGLIPAVDVDERGRGAGGWIKKVLPTPSYNISDR
jgi:hypothetical protein